MTLYLNCQLSLSQGHSQMLFAVVTLSPTTTLASTYSTLQSAVAYSRDIMSPSNDTIEVVILRINNGVAKVVKRYHRDNI
jgi:hypothetical protein